MKRHSGAAILVLTAVLVSTAAQTPPQGHPLIPPYPGSTEGAGVDVSSFDEFDIPTGPTKDGQFSKTEHVEGKLTTFGYGTPPGRSVLEVFRNYESALKAAGFVTLFTC